ncbi:unnamed protein product, partial [Closterium sp. NIES-53]
MPHQPNPILDKWFDPPPDDEPAPEAGGIPWFQLTVLGPDWTSAVLESSRIRITVSLISRSSRAKCTSNVSPTIPSSTAINGQHFPNRHLVGRVGEFEGELNYDLPQHLRTHPEQSNLVIRPLGCPLDASRLPNVFMGFFEPIPLRKPWPASFYGTPIKPGSDIPCVTSGAISGGGSGGGSSDGLSFSINGSLESSSSGNSRNGTENVIFASADSVPGETDWIKKLGCHGPPCPSFGSCTARFPNVQACWNPHLVDEPEIEIAHPINCPLKRNSTALDRWRKGTGRAPFDETCSSRKDFTPHGASALQVMRLEDVFVTDGGVNLNRTHAFVRNRCWRFPGTVIGGCVEGGRDVSEKGCGGERVVWREGGIVRVQMAARHIPETICTTPFPSLPFRSLPFPSLPFPSLPFPSLPFHQQAKYEAGHMVHELPAVFNLAHQPGDNFYHFLVELLPLFLVSAPLMPSTLRLLPVLLRHKQVRWYEQLGAPLIGIQADQIRLLPTYTNDLFHADVVYQ